MREQKHQRDVEKTLKNETKKDKAKIDLGRISKFGLLEMSRQRIRPPIEFGTYVACEHCGGRGVIRSPEATALAALRMITQRISKGQVKMVRGRLHPGVASFMQNRKRREMASLEERFGVDIILEADHTIKPGQLDLDFIRRDGTDEKESVGEA